MFFNDFACVLVARASCSKRYFLSQFDLNFAFDNYPPPPPVNCHIGCGIWQKFRVLSRLRPFPPVLLCPAALLVL